MKTAKINLHNLQNAEHFQFHTDVLNLIVATTPAALKSTAECAAYAAIFAREDEIMRRIAKSAVTMLIAEADHTRDEAFRGLVSTWQAAMSHFNPAARAAAARLAPVFETYGNIAGEALAKQSADTYNILQELREKHAEDVSALGFTPWLDALETRNLAVEELMRDRYEEVAARDGVALRVVRLMVDAAYVAVADRVDALQLLEGGAEGAPYAAFIATLNAIVERARNIVAARRGRAAAKKEEESTDNTADGTKPVEPMPAEPL